jgi:hypothetical protein
MDTADRLLSCLSSALTPGGNNARVAETLAGELDVARSTAAAIDTVRNPDLTTGRTLDYVAQMFNVARTSGESDDSLRSRIVTQIKRYYSCGTLTDIRDVIEYFTGLTGDRVRIREPPDVHEGWGYGEGRYGFLPWGTPHAMFRIELLGDDHTAIMLPGLVAGIDLVRAAGVYVQDLVICSTLQVVRGAAEGSTLWVVPAPLRSGFGTCGYGTCGYGGVYAIRATAEGAVDLQVNAEAAVVAGIRHGLGFGQFPYGWEGYGGRIDTATIEYDVQGEAPVEVTVSTDHQILVETVLGYGAGRLGTEPYGSRAGSVDALAGSAVDLVVEPTAAVTAQAASYLGYGAWRYGQYEFGY